MLSSALAKTNGVPLVMAMTHRPGLKPLLNQLGVTEVFNPRESVREDIIHFLSDAPLEHLTTVPGTSVELVRVLIPRHSPMADRPLRELGPDSGIVVAAAEDESDRGHVPGPDATLVAGRHALVACESGRDQDLRRIFGL